MESGLCSESQLLFQPSGDVPEMCHTRVLWTLHEQSAFHRPERLSGNPHDQLGRTDGVPSPDSTAGVRPGPPDPADHRLGGSLPPAVLNRGDRGRAGQVTGTGGKARQARDPVPTDLPPPDLKVPDFVNRQYRSCSSRSPTRSQPRPRGR